MTPAAALGGVNPAGRSARHILKILTRVEPAAGFLDRGSALYANVLLGRRGKAWKMIGVDPHGVDLGLRGRLARLDFAAPVHDAPSCRAELVRLMQEARRREAPTGIA